MLLDYMEYCNFKLDVYSRNVLHQIACFISAYDTRDWKTCLSGKQIFNDYTLLFVLGMLKAKEETRVCTIASVSKELSDFAKEQDMELLSMAAAAKGSDKKTTKPRVRNLRKNESVAEESNKTLNLNDNNGTDSIIEPVKNESIDESEKTEETVPGLLEDLVKAAEKKTGYGYSKRIDEIRKAVATASDEKIGLPFQMQMLFGEKGQALADELTGHFRELKGGN